MPHIMPMNWIFLFLIVWMNVLFIMMINFWSINILISNNFLLNKKFYWKL